MVCLLISGRDQVYGGQQAGMPPMMAKPMQQQQQQQRSKNYPFPTNRQHNPGKPVPTGRQDKTKESKEMSKAILYQQPYYNVPVVYMALSSMPFQGPKKSRFPGPTHSNGLRNGYVFIIYL